MKKSLLFLLGLLPLLTKGQLTVRAYSSLSQEIEKLFGPGVTIRAASIQLSGRNNAIGVFQNGAALGFAPQHNSGLLISTGVALNANGINATNNISSETCPGAPQIVPDLSSAFSAQLFSDFVVIEIEAQFGSPIFQLKNLIWASEENPALPAPDRFGIFLSQAGTEQNAPATPVYTLISRVAPDFVEPITHTRLSQLSLPGDTRSVFNRFTEPLYISWKVEPLRWYKIKIVVAASELCADDSALLLPFGCMRVVGAALRNPPTVLCPGSRDRLAYSADPFVKGQNIYSETQHWYYVELSNPNGEFYPENLPLFPLPGPMPFALSHGGYILGGALTPDSSGTIPVSYPANLTPGSGYRMRIRGWDGAPLPIPLPPDNLPLNGIFQSFGSPAPSPLTIPNPNFRVWKEPQDTVRIGQTLFLFADSPAPGATFLWQGPNNFTSTAQNPVIFYSTLDMRGEYTVTATVGGCAMQRTLMVYGGCASPSASISATQACVNGAPVVVTVRGAQPGSITWTCPGCIPQPGPNTTVANISWATAGTKTIKLESPSYPLGPPPNPPCPNLDRTFTVIVNNPIQNFNISIDPIKDAYCINERIELVANHPPYTGHIWNCDGCSPAPTSTYKPPPVSWASPGVKTVRVSLNVAGCGNYTDSTTINVLPSPTLQFSNAQRCGQGTVAFTIQNPNPNYNYLLYTQSAGGDPISSRRGAGNEELSLETPPLTTTTTFYLAALDSVTGCSSTVRQAVIARINPPPAAPNLVGGNRSFHCGSGSRTLTVNASSTTATSFILYDENNRIVSQASISPYFLRTDTVTVGAQSLSRKYYLEGINPATGCTSATRTEITVDFIPLPRAQIVLPPRICEQEQVIVSFNGARGPGVAYRWQFSGFNSDTRVQPPNFTTPGPFFVTWRTSGLKTITLTVTDSGCSQTVTQTVNALPLPDSRFTLTRTSPAGFSCVNRNIGAQVNNPLPDARYRWSCTGCQAAAPLDSIGPHNLSWESPGIKTITLSVVSSQGCQSPVDTQYVTVNPAPSIRLTASSRTVCENQQVTLNASFNNAPPIPNIVWTGCSGCSPTIEGSRSVEVKTAWANAGTKTVTLRATNSGCPPVDTSITIRVNPNPAPPILRDTSVCGAGTYTLRARMGEPAGNYINWYDRDNNNLPRFLGERSAPLYALEANLAFTKDFWAESVIEATGCKSTQANLRVTVNPLPPSPTLLDSARCGPGPLRLRLAPNRFYEFNWSNFPSLSAPILRRGETLDIDVPTDQRYYVWARDINTGCIGRIREVIPIVHNVPQADFVFSRSVLCQDSSINIRFTGNAPTGSYYRWSCSGCENLDPRSPLEGINRGTLLIRWLGWGPRAVRVIVESAQGCRDTAEKTITVSPHPFASLQVSGNNLCINDSMLVQAARIPFEAIYRWNCSGCFPQPNETETSKIVRWFTPGPKAISLVTQTPGCATAQTQVNITVSELPIAQINTEGVERVCAEALLTLSATTVNRAWYQWNCDGCGIAGNGSLAQPGPLQVSWGLPGTKSVTLRVNTPGCREAQTRKLIFVDTLPQPPANDTLVVCGQGPVQLKIRGVPDFSAAAVRIYTQPRGGTALFTDFTPPYEFELPIATSTTFYTETQGYPPGNCFSVRGVFVVRVVNTLGAPSASEVTRCGFGTVTFTARAGLPGGRRMCLYSSPTAQTPINCQEGNIQNEFLLVSSPIQTHACFYLENESIDRIGCASRRVEVCARVVRTLPTPIFSDVVFCDSGSAVVPITVAPLLEQNFIQLFDRPSGGLPLHSDITPPYQLRLPTVRTNTTFYIENTSLLGTCTSSVRAPLRAIVVPSPKAPQTLTPRIIGCSSEFIFTVLVEQPGRLRLYNLNEELIKEEAIGAYPQLHSLVIPNVTTSSRYYLTLFDAANGCQSPRSELLTAEMITCPGAPIAPRQDLCAPGSPIEIIPTLTLPLGEGVRIYTQPFGGAPIAQSNIPPYRLWLPAVGTSTTFYLESYIGSCASCRRNPLEIRVIETLQPPSAERTRRCGPGPVTFSVNHSVPQSRTYLVYDAPFGNVVAQIGQPPFTFTTEVQTTTTFYLVGLSVLGNCPSEPVPIVAEVIPAPGAPIVTRKSRCDAGTLVFPVTLTPPFGTGVALYTLASGGLPLAQDNQPNYELPTPVITTTTIFFVEAFHELTGCRSERVPVTAAIEKPPFLTANAVQRCGSGVLTFSVDLSVGGNNEIRLYTAPDAVTPYSTTQMAPYRVQTPGQTAAVGYYYLEAINLENGCISNRLQVEGRIIQPPGPPVINQDRICADSQPIFTAAMGSPAGDEIALYTSPTEPLPFSRASHAPYRLSAPPILTQTAFYIGSRIIGANCESERVRVVALPRPQPPSVEKVNICQAGRVTLTVTTTQANGTEMRLYSSPQPDIAIASDVEPPFHFELPFVSRAVTYYVIATNSFTGCSSLPAPAVIELNERPGIPLVQTAYRCGPGPLTLSVAQGFPAGNIIRMLDAQEGGTEVSRALSPIGYYYELSTPLVSESRYYYLESINTTTQCTSARRPVQVLIEAQPEVRLLHNGPICVGDTLKLRAECRAADFYIFEGPGGFRRQTNFQCCVNRPNLSLEDEGVYSVTAVLGRCTSNVATAGGPILMPSFPRPILQTDANCENEPYCCICQNTTLTFKIANSELYPEGARFRWKSNMLDTITAVPYLTLNGGFEAPQLEMRAQVITPCSTEFSLPRSFCVKPSPQLPNIRQTQSGCQAGARLTLAITNLEDQVAYTWNGPCLSAAQGKTFEFTIGQSCGGVYSIEARSLSGCGVRVHTIDVFTAPVPSQITASARENVLCAGQPIELRAELISHLNYRWVGPGGFSSSAPNPFIPAANTAASGVYEVYGFRNNCTTGVARVNITVNNPIVGVNASSNSPLCSGQQLRLTASNIPAGASVRWQGPQNFSSALASPVINNSGAENSGIYTLTVSVPGCPNAIFTTNAIVNNPPSGAALTLASNSPLCEGQTLRITAVLIGGASYTWRGPNQFLSAQREVIIGGATASQSGVYSVSIEIPGCPAAQTTANIKVSPRPAAVINGPNALCAGGTLRLTATEAPEATYQWRGPLGFSSFGPAMEINNITREASGLYSLAVTVPGCPTENQVKNIEVNSLLVNPVILSNVPVCAGQALSVTLVNAPPDLNYHWQGPQNFSVRESSFSIPNMTLARAGVYTLNATSNGCAPFTTTVNVVVSTEPAFPQIAPPPILCEGSTYTFSLVNPEAGVTYTWRKPNGETVTAPRLEINNLKLSDAGVYQVCAQKTGCSVTCNAVPLTVSQNPTQIQISHNGPVCSGQTLQLSATRSPNATSYIWRGPQGFVAEGPLATRSNMTLADSGAYEVQVTVPGCGTFTTRARITVIGLSALRATSNSPLCAGQNLNLSASFNTSFPQIIYRWEGPGGFLSTQSNPLISSVTTLQKGVYTVAVQAGNCPAERVTVNVLVDSPIGEVRTSQNSPLCSPGNLQINTLIPQENVQYEWKGPAGFRSTFPNVFIANASPEQAGVYTLTVHTQNRGCPSKEIRIPFEVRPKVEPPACLDNITVFANDTLYLCKGLRGAPGLRYQWRGPNGFFSEGDIVDVRVHNAKPSDSGIYTLTVISPGCSSASFTKRVTIEEINCATPQITQVQALTTTQVSINWNPVPGAVCYVVAYGKITEPESRWFEQPVVAPFDQLSIGNLQTGERYGAKVRANCSSCALTSGALSPYSSTRVFTTLLGKQNEISLKPWEAVVYPNPGKGQFNVSLRNITETGSLAISLRDITGREVASTVFSELTPGAEELTIPLFWEGLSAGVYTLQLRSATQNQTLRLAIEP